MPPGKEVEKIIKKYKEEKGALLSILEDIQIKYNCLPKKTLKHISKILEVPLSKIYGINTFFNFFSLNPRGRHLINLCFGTTCYVKGIATIAEKLKAELKIEIGETTKDLRFTLEAVRCLGCCSLAPAMMIDNHVYGRLKPGRVENILSKYK